MELYFQYNSYNKASDAFAALKPGIRKPAKSTVAFLVAKFRQTGSLHDRKKEGKKISSGPANAAGVIVAKSLNPALVASDIASYAGISEKSVVKILSEHKYHQSQFMLMMTDAAYSKRARFAEKVLEMIKKDDSLLGRTCFTDQSTFYLNGRIDHENFWYWGSHNPTICEGTPKIHIWAAIYRDVIIGPFFIDDEDYDGSYLNMLQNEAGPALSDAADNDDVLWLQDGDTTSEVEEFLNEAFPARWIGSGGPISWPDNSPDLTPMGYFFWGYIKHRVFQSRPTDIEDLKNRIITVCKEMSIPLFGKARLAFYNRLSFCAANNGGNFEHML